MIAENKNKLNRKKMKAIKTSLQQQISSQNSSTKLTKLVIMNKKK